MATVRGPCHGDRKPDSENVFHYPANLAIRVLIGAALLFSGCAETRIYQNGQLVACIQGDCTNITITWPGGGSFHADTLNHSVATAAAYTGSTAVIGAAATGVVAGLRAAP